MASWFANFVVFELCLLMVIVGYLSMAGWMKKSWGRILAALVLLEIASIVVSLIEPRLQQLGIWRHLLGSISLMVGATLAFCMHRYFHERLAK